VCAEKVRHGPGSKRSLPVIASQRVGAERRPMTGSAKQSRAAKKDWIASSRSLPSGRPKAGPVGSSQ
jgi:hypothetical protein